MRMGRLTSIEVLSCLVLLAGAILDHVSTRIALSLPYTYETNAFVVMLISKGLWVHFECLVVAAGIAFPLLVTHLKRGSVYRAVLAFPLALGTARLVASFWNLSVIYNVLRVIS